MKWNQKSDTVHVSCAILGIFSSLFDVLSNVFVCVKRLVYLSL